MPGNLKDRIRKNLPAMLLAAALVVLVFRILYVTVIHRKVPALSAAVLGDAFSIDCGQLEERMRTELGILSDLNIVSATAYNPESPLTEQILITEIRAHAADLIFGDRSSLLRLASKECLADLSEDPDSVPVFMVPVTGIPEIGEDTDRPLLCGIAVTSDHRELAETFIELHRY